jgi:hypothetical protein
VSRFLDFITSPKLAVILGGVLMFFGLVGAVVPQESGFDASSLAQWQADHPLWTAVLGSLGLFRTFSSVPFVITVVVLAINTFACILRRFLRSRKQNKRFSTAELGSILLHIAIIVTLFAGLVSATCRLDGWVLLTEGQDFTGAPHDYMMLKKGLLRGPGLVDSSLRLEEVRADYKDGHLVGKRSMLMDRRLRSRCEVQVNNPQTFGGLTFTQDKIGFSPRLSVTEEMSGLTVADSYVVLKTFGETKGREYRDYLDLPQIGRVMLLTLYPDHISEGGVPVKRGDEPVNPLLRIEWQDGKGNTVSEDILAMGGSASVEGYKFQFEELRRWAMFRVVNDPGYQIAVFSFWIGLLSLLVRYVPDLVSWFRE